MKTLLNITATLGLICLFWHVYSQVRREITVHRQRTIAKTELYVGMHSGEAQLLITNYFKNFETIFDGKLEIKQSGDTIRTYLVYPGSLFTGGTRLELNLCEKKIIAIE